MDVRTSIRVVLWSALTGGVVAISTLVLLDWMMPGEVSIAPLVSGEVVIDMDGAVATPGLVTLPAGSRLQAAIDAAGGLTTDADVSRINLAARIGDGEHITIPVRRSLATPAGAVDAVTDTAHGALIDVNSAGVSELDQLPGIGPAIAQRIIDYRELNGPFATVEELDQVEGISPEMVEELRPLVSVGG